MRRYLQLMGYAWLVLYNITVLALFTLVPLWAVWQLGWPVLWVAFAIAAAAWLVARPFALLGLLVGLSL